MIKWALWFEFVKEWHKTVAYVNESSNRGEVELNHAAENLKKIESAINNRG